MVRISSVFVVLGMVILISASFASADIPHMISYQGKLTASSGGCINDTVQMTFSIYPDTLGSPADWTETQTQVVVREGIFNVLLGAVDTISQAVFDGGMKYLGVQVESDPEMRPLKAMVSVPYAYRAGAANGGGGGGGWVDDGSVVRLETEADDVGIGTASPGEKLEVDGNVLVSGKANIGPGNTNTGNYAFVAGESNEAAGNYSTVTGGQSNTASNSFSVIGGGKSNASGGWYNTNAGGHDNRCSGMGSTVPGGGHNRAAGDYSFTTGWADTIFADYSYLFGIDSDLDQDSTLMVDMPHIRFGDQTSGYEFPTSDGDSGQVMATDGSGSLTWTDVSGSGIVNCHDCDTVFVNVDGPDSVVADSGSAFLGKASGNRSGELAGVSGHADNSSSGSACGGHFSTSSSGTGNHYGVRADSYSSSLSNSIGCKSFARNTSIGSAYGFHAYAENTSEGSAYGGYFATYSSGTGLHYGIKAEARGSAAGGTYGSVGWAESTPEGSAYGGYFSTSSSGTGNHYGVRGVGRGSSGYQASGVAGHASHTSTGSAVGCAGSASNSSTGRAYGGSFVAWDEGTGTHNGILADAYGSSSAATYGVDGWSQNTSSGSVYAGHFYAADTGTGPKYGVHASAPANNGYAGYFAGNVRITDSLVVLGAKSAAVKADDGEYRLLYSQESPEVWFEDFGEAQLVNGRANVELDPLFARTVNTEITYHVFLTPGGDCNGLYVADKNLSSFEVRELKGGDADLTFSYRIVAKRRGYENIRLAKMGKPTPEEVAREQIEHQAEMKKERASREEQRQEMKKQHERMEAENVITKQEMETR